MKSSDCHAFGVQWVPVFECTIAIFSILLCYILYVCYDHFDPKAVPTISGTATKYPGQKFFIIGIGVVALMFVIVAEIACDILVLNGRLNAKYMKLLSYPIFVSLVGVSSVTVSDQEYVHCTFAFTGFGLLLVFCICFTVIASQLKILKARVAKICLLVCAGLALMGFGILAIVAEAPMTIAAKSIMEYIYVVLVFAIICTMFWDFQGVKFVLALE